MLSTYFMKKVIEHSLKNQAESVFCFKREKWFASLTLMNLVGPI